MYIDVYVGLKSKKYAFVTEDNYECWIIKNINENIIGDEVKYEDCKNIWYKYIRYERNRIQCKDHNIETYKTNKIYLPRYEDNTKMLNDRYSRLLYIHKCILINHTKIVCYFFSNFIFPGHENMVFFQPYVREDYYAKKREQKRKNYYQGNKEKTTTNIAEYFRSFSEEENLKIEIMLVLEIKRCQTEIDREEQNLRIITKRISLLNGLIIGVKELENVYFAR